jgi:hypothetical protein
MTQLADSLDDGRETVPLVEEQAVVRKRKRLTGGVRIRTVVHDDEQVVDAPLRAEQVEVKRVALDDHWVEAPFRCGRRATPRSSPCTRRWSWVETRLRATEEVHLIRRQATSSTREHEIAGCFAFWSWLRGEGHRAPQPGRGRDDQARLAQDVTLSVVTKLAAAVEPDVRVHRASPFRRRR